MAQKDIKKEHLKEHYHNQQGKDYILYAGLISEFHQVNDAWLAGRGVKDEIYDQRGIAVEVVELPSEENDGTAVVLATVTMSSGAKYTEVGDANKHNVNRMILPARIRMAATRAKGRALRDALNIGDTMYEELPGAELTEVDDGAPSPVASAPEDGPARTDQLVEIKNLIKKLGRSIAVPADITVNKATVFIAQLTTQLAEAETKQEAIYSEIAELIPAYAEASESGQNDVVAEVKKAAKIKTALIGEAPIAQQEAALAYLKSRLAA